MILFGQPGLLWLALPALLLWLWLARKQRRALGAVEAGVAERFRGLLTIHDRRSLDLHLVLLLAIALLLVVAAARPILPGATADLEGGGRLLFVLDASASMYATDVEAFAEGSPEPANRLALAREVALDLVGRLEGHSFAVASFSGSSTIHLPMTGQVDQVTAALEALENHNFYRGTGSSLASALDSAFHFQDPRRGGLQVLLLGDGELPAPESFEEPLEALAEQGVPVHAVAIGSVEGQTRRILDFRDIAAGKEDPAVLTADTTRRVDAHLARIAERTGGVFGQASPATVARIATAVRRHRAPVRPDDEAARGRDLSTLPLFLVLLAFLVETLWIGRRPKPDLAFDLDRLGPSAALLAFLALALPVACGDSPIERAHVDNELGISNDALGRYDAARPLYERSAGYGERAEIPIHNLARSLVLREAYSEAHELFQQALEIEPDLPAAHYNDGVALYRWGGRERDPRGCDLERTLDLWQAARDRFSTTLARVDDDSPLARSARANHARIRAEIEAIEALIAEPPPECRAPQASAGGAGSSSPESGGGQGKGGGEGGGGEGGGGEGGAGEGGGGGGGGEGDGEPDGQPEDDQGGSGAGGNADPGEGGGDGSSGDGEPPDGPPEAGSGEADGPLSPEEIEAVLEALARLREQAGEPGKYHRRTLAEQFSREGWENPDEVIRW